MGDTGGQSDSDINVTDSDEEKKRGSTRKKRGRTGDGEKEGRLVKRKERHNEVERKRRTLMNDKLDELRTLLPGCNSDTSKADCLVSAVAYINWLHHQSAALYSELVKNGIDFKPESRVVLDPKEMSMSLPGNMKDERGKDYDDDEDRADDDDGDDSAQGR